MRPFLAVFLRTWFLPLISVGQMLGTGSAVELGPRLKVFGSGETRTLLALARY